MRIIAPWQTRLFVCVATAACGPAATDTGVDAQGGEVDVAVDVDAATDAALPPAGPWRVVVGEIGACAIHVDGRVKCWGGFLGHEQNEFFGDEPGEMGANLAAIDLGTGRTARDIAVGSDHVCALLDNFRVKCWGSNQYGQLGLGDMVERGRAPGTMGDDLPYVDLGTGRTVKAISAGVWLTCAILDDDSLKCWGLNASGGCGLGDTQRHGAAPGQMGDALPAVDLGTGRTAAKIFVGTSRACAILDNGDLKCWGNNFSGALGAGQLTTHVGVMPGQMGDALAPVALGTGLAAATITHQGESICATMTTGGIKCWGRGSEGELAVGEAENRGDEPGEMGDNLAFAALGPEQPTAFVGAAGHGCAAYASGEVACWGANYDGTLGIGVADNTIIGDAPAEVGANLPRVKLAGPAVALSAAGLETCATLADGRIQCWGINSLGHLGIGDKRNRGNDTADMGSALPFTDLGP